MMIQMGGFNHALFPTPLKEMIQFDSYVSHGLVQPTSRKAKQAKLC